MKDITLELKTCIRDKSADEDMPLTLKTFIRNKSTHERYNIWAQDLYQG